MKINVNTDMANSMSKGNGKEGDVSGPGLVQVSKPANSYGHIKVKPSPTNVEGHNRGGE